MSKPELVLHIGHGKCGSSAIQRFLSANRTVLAKQQVYVFDADLKIDKDGHGKGLPNPVLKESNWDLAADRIRGAAHAARPGEKFVLTAEVLSQPRKSAFVERFISLFDARVIHYIRRQDDWCYSAWKQWQLKRGVKLQDWIDFCSTRKTPAYMRTYQGYEALGLTTDAYRMRVLDKRFLLGEDLLQDFCSEAEIDAEDLVFPAKPANPNFDRALLEVFRAADFIFQDSHDNKPFTWVQKNLSEEAIRRRGGLSPAQSRSIMEAHLGQNKAICETFFADRSRDFGEVFGMRFDSEAAPVNGAASTEAAEERLLKLEHELESTRRALGYVLDFLIRQKQN